MNTPTDQTTNFQQLPEGTNTNIDLGFLEMWLDGIKSIKLRLDPVSDCFASGLGVACCVAVTVANAESDRKHTATRYDVIHASELRRARNAEANCGFQIGSCLGDALVDTASVAVGTVVGGLRAGFFYCTGNTSSDNSVFGYTHEELKDVDPVDSCTHPTCFSM